MIYEKFLKDNLIKKEKPDFRQIEYQIKRANKDLKTAEANLSIDLTWAFAIAYHAMMRASKALIYSKGYREKSHYYLLVALKSLFVDTNALSEEISSEFHDAMILREDADYHGNFTKDGADAVLETAKELLALAKSILRIK